MDLPVDGTSLPITWQVYLDYDSKSEFVGFFISSRIPDPYKACVALSGLDHENSLKHMGTKTSGGIVGQMTNQDDLIFTGRIYIYHEGDLSIEQRAELIRLYRSRKLDLQFRGIDYMLLRR
jgi:hypothetical protein